LQQTSVEQSIIDPTTERIRRTSDRAARWYDLQDWLPEVLAFRRWRRLRSETDPSSRTSHPGRRGAALAPPRADLKVGPYEACLPGQADEAMGNLFRWSPSGGGGEYLWQP